MTKVPRPGRAAGGGGDPGLGAVDGGASSRVPFDRCFCLTGHRSAPALMASVVGDDLRHDAGYR